MAVNADCPKIDVTLLDYRLNGRTGGRGVGEIDLAITGATCHAAGVRVRNLPIRIEDLLEAANPLAHVVA